MKLTIQSFCFPSESSNVEDFFVSNYNDETDSALHDLLADDWITQHGMSVVEEFDTSQNVHLITDMGLSKSIID